MTLQGRQYSRTSNRARAFAAEMQQRGLIEPRQFELPVKKNKREPEEVMKTWAILCPHELGQEIPLNILFEVPKSEQDEYWRWPDP